MIDFKHALNNSSIFIADIGIQSAASVPRNRANKFMLNELKNKIFVQSAIRNTFKGSGGICDKVFLFLFSSLLGISTAGEKKIARNKSEREIRRVRGFQERSGLKRPDRIRSSHFNNAYNREISIAILYHTFDLFRKKMLYLKKR